MSRPTSDTSGRVPTSGVRVALDASVERLLSDAMALLGTDDAAAVIGRALEELVERQRFLALVAKHEKAASDSA